MDIYDACKFVHVICKYTGTAPYSLQKNKREYKFLKKDKILNDVIALGIVSLTLVGFYYLVLARIAEGKVKYIAFHLMNCMYVANTFLILYVSRFYGRNYTINLFQIITDIDNNFYNLTAKQIDYKEYHKIILKFAIIKYLITFVSILCDVLFNLELIYGTLMYQLGTLINANRCYFVSIILINVKQKLNTMHFYMLNFNPLQEKEITSEQLKLAVKIYTIIFEVCRKVREIFKMEFLLRILTSLIYSTFSLYLFDNNNFFNYFFGQLWAVIYIMELVVLLFLYSSLATTAKKTVQLMEDLEKAVGKSNLPYKQVELFSLQVYVEDFKFSVFGCFPLDWTLLHSMVAGVATYLVIFHQFSNMEKKG